MSFFTVDFHSKRDVFSLGLECAFKVVAEVIEEYGRRNDAGRCWTFPAEPNGEPSQENRRIWFYRKSTSVFILKFF